MIVVADTSPINYLVLIGHADVLSGLFKRIVIPDAVRQELSSARTPPAVRTWLQTPPLWLEVRPPIEVSDQIDPELGKGEREAIALALKEPSAILIIDEAKGRAEATRKGISTVGTLGILERAHDRGLLDLRGALAKLQQTNFFISPQLIVMSLRKRY